MKKPLLITIIIIVLILALPFINFLRWSFHEKKPIDIAILDKTVPTPERIHHKSLSWVLNSERFVKKNKNRSYSFRKDYYGFAPTRPLKEKGYNLNEYHLSEMIELPEKIDAIYFADTYGVFFNDWYAGINKSRRSRKIYGGLNNTDYLLVNEMKNRNKLIILEYNSFDFPTDEFESYRTQEKLGIQSKGWSGKYFKTLDSTSRNFPIWMTSMYRKEYNEPWSFTKPGIVLLSERNIIVLEEGTHLSNALPFIVTDNANCEKFGVPASVAFDKWFDIIDPMGNLIISEFQIETTAAGDSLLADHMISRIFPAVVQEPLNNNVFYFSGDFATNEVCFPMSRIKGFSRLKGILYSDKPNDTRRFFWLYYKPLINTILTDYYNSINGL